MIFPGTVIKNRYQAESILGRGGMGEVWICNDILLSRKVVLKIVSPALAKEKLESAQIFIDEARIGASLIGHPNVVAIFDILNESNEDSKLLAIVMEYVEGYSCANWIEIAKNKIDEKTQFYIALQIAIEICKALSYSHRNNILHRDIKPLNIFISKYGIAKIGDFGIARFVDAVTREHTVWNFRSPAYSAPEQWNNLKPTKKTDIYQLGCTLFQLFTGQLPFDSNSVAGLIQMHLISEPKKPTDLNSLISERLSELLVKCLAKKPADRPELWEIVDAIAKELQKKYQISIQYEETDSQLISKIGEITDFDLEQMKERGIFEYEFEDFNEAISEAIELSMLDGVKIKLEIISDKN